jgi:hypothetical protein
MAKLPHGGSVTADRDTVLPCGLEFSRSVRARGLERDLRSQALLLRYGAGYLSYAVSWNPMFVLPWRC